MTSLKPSTVQPALIFIPDISGFTEFISNTEISHSKHIIEELLESLIDANTLDLQISEIEGDAILFYRFGQAPTAAELLNQVQQMFVNFHKHLKKYETHRICHCGACRSAQQLTLKFIAHYGEITTNQVKQYVKLFGKEVILAHRLLKNDIASQEYVLFTHSLINSCSSWVDVPTVAWADLEQGEQQYDCGAVRYCCLPLEPLRSRVPEPVPADYRISGHTRHVFCSKAIISAPMEMVFDVVADLPWRSRWIVGALPEVTHLNHAIFQEGSTHHCLANGPVIVTHDIENQKDRICMSETNLERNFSVVYTLQRLEEEKTLVEANAYMKRNLFKSLLFRLFIRKAYLEVYRKTWVNLNHYCRSLIEQGLIHSKRIIMRQDLAQEAS